MKTTIIFLVLLLSIQISAGKGKISGVVYDAETKETIQGANILIEGTRIGTVSDGNGFYKIDGIDSGVYTFVCSYIGYTSHKAENITVQTDSTAKLNFYLTPGIPAMEELVVADSKLKLTTGMQKSHPARGGRQPAGLYRLMLDDIGIPHNTEEYSKIEETGFKDVLVYPQSTFAADVDAASYSNIRRFIMQDQTPYKDAVRIEEMINYFNYDYPKPSSGHPLSINLEIGDTPWNENTKLVHIGIKGDEITKDETSGSNLVFLLDVSGSMNSPKKLPLLKKSFSLLVDQLEAKDRISIVVYAGAAGLILPSTPASEKETILGALNKLQAGGSTAGGAGLKLAYDVAEKNLIEGGNNRVILATDGDFNVGISSTSEMVRFIEEKRDKGIFLTVLGFGMGNYKDHRLQEIADRGNGNHAYIDNILEAKKVLVHDLLGTLFTIAKDVKIQVEFNPAKILSYRLIGYENRRLNTEDFKDDKKDAGEIGSGHTVTALYEIVMNDGKLRPNPADTKYQTTHVKPESYDSDELLTVKVRYKKPDGVESIEFEKILKGDPEKDNISDNFIFSAAVAEFGHILRDSEFKENSNIENLLADAAAAKGADQFGYRSEFIDLVERYKLISRLQP